MKKPFQVGDRVAVYGSFSPKHGGSVRYLDGDRGTLLSSDNGAGFEVRLDVPFRDINLMDPDVIDSVHPKQCRRLVKRELRKVAVSWAEDSGFNTRLIQGSPLKPGTTWVFVEERYSLRKVKP